MRDAMSLLSLSSLPSPAHALVAAFRWAGLTCCDAHALTCLPAPLLLRLQEEQNVPVADLGRQHADEVWLACRLAPMHCFWTRME